MVRSGGFRPVVFVAHSRWSSTLNHVYEGVLELGAVIFVASRLAGWAFERARVRWGERWGVEGIDQPGCTAEVIFSIYFFVVTPMVGSIIGTEAEADPCSIATSGQPDGFAFAAMQLSEYRKISPGYWKRSSSTTILPYNRVHASMQWKAEHGERTAAAPAAAGR